MRSWRCSLYVQETWPYRTKIIYVPHRNSCLHLQYSGSGQSKLSVQDYYSFLFLNSRNVGRVGMLWLFSFFKPVFLVLFYFINLYPAFQGPSLLPKAHLHSKELKSNH